jgi:hypothetical protein
MQNENDLNPNSEKPQVPGEDVLWDSDQAAGLEDEAASSQEAPVESEGESSQPPQGGLPPAPAESKSRRFFRHLIRWAAGVLIVFGLGLLTGIFLLYRPAVQKAEAAQQTAQTEMQQASDQITDLEGQVADLEGRVDALQSLKDANTQLLAAQEDLKLHIAILDARLDVANALLALSRSEPDSASALIILDQTGATFDRIGQFLANEQLDTLTKMKQRLELVLTEIENDPYAAQSDLDVLATNLLQLEDSLIGQ